LRRLHNHVLRGFAVNTKTLGACVDGRPYITPARHSLCYAYLLL